MRRFMDRMAEVVHTYPDRTALADDTRSMTYAQLAEESGKVYAYLKRLGLGTEDAILVLMPRSAGLFAAVAGVLRAGAMFIPLEDTYPADRVAFIREDVGCKLVLDKPLYDRIMAQESPLAGYEHTEEHDACYAVYTSGSTGNPKGVLQEYGCLDLVAAQVPEAEERPELICAMMEASYFAAGIDYEGRHLLSAATIHIMDRNLVKNFARFEEYLLQHRIQQMFMPPSYARVYKNPSPHLKTVIVAGEPANSVYFEGGRPQILDSLGMSESGAPLCEMVFDHAYDIAPVGVPTLDVFDIHLEDEDGRRIEGPGEGEFCYHNPYFRGYINLPDKTAEAMRGGCFHGGDLARRDEDGRYYIVGRIDDMFKINGNRVEPAEIERWVRKATGLTKVLAKGFVSSARSFICVYFIRSEAEELGIWDGSELKVDLGLMRQNLPDYMMPSHYMALDAFPTNANGKLVRRELPEPDLSAEAAEYVEPANEAERDFCDAMARVLELDRVGATDDFYRIGGDSIHAAMLLAELDQMGYDIALSALYELRCSRALANRYGSQSEDRAALDEADRLARTRPQPILPMQTEHVRQLACEPESTEFNIGQLFQLKDDVDLGRLREAVDAVFRAHPALLTRFEEANDGYVQVYDERLFQPTEVVELSDDEFAQLKAGLVRPLPGLGAAPHRRAIYRTDSAVYLFVDVHHGIADGTSMALLRDQIYACYADEGYRIPADHYYRFVEEGARDWQPDTERYREAEAFYADWEDDGVIKDCACILTPDLAGPRGANGTLVGSREHARLGGQETLLYLTATCMAVAAANREPKGFVYTVYNGRDSYAKAHSFGCHATEMPILVDLSCDPTPRQLLDAVQAQLDFGMGHCNHPYAATHPHEECNTVLFNYQKDTMDLGAIQAIVQRELRLPMGQSGMVTTGLIDNSAKDWLTWYCGYATGWYTRGRIEELHERFNEAVRWLKEGIDA